MTMPTSRKVTGRGGFRRRPSGASGQVSTRALIAAWLTSCAMLLAGCMVDGAESGQGTIPPRPDGLPGDATRAQLTATPAVATVGSLPHSPPTPRVTRVSVSVAELVRQHLAEAYGRTGSKASWYDDILGVAVRFNTAVIRTDLSSAPDDRQKAETICRAVSRFPSTAAGRELGALSVEVYGRDDRLLAASQRADSRAASRRPDPTP